MKKAFHRLDQLPLPVRVLLALPLVVVGVCDLLAEVLYDGLKCLAGGDQ